MEKKPEAKRKRTSVAKTKKVECLKISEVFSNSKRSFNVYDQEGKVLGSYLKRSEAEDFIKKN